jgi:hypothetical protein
MYFTQPTKAIVQEGSGSKREIRFKDSTVKLFHWDATDIAKLNVKASFGKSSSLFYSRGQNIF